VPAQNRLTLDATLVAREALRYTPAGIPALDCTLAHASQQQEAGGERRVECELAAVAFGDIAQALARVPAERVVRCEGFLARRWRTGTSVALHITRFIELKD
jgi:primosomal replication protein N